MFTRHRGAQAATVLGAVGVLLGLSGCAAKVKRDEFTSEVARLREEMQAGDRQVGTQIGGRIDSTNQALADHARRLDALEQEIQALRNEYNVSVEKVKGMLKFDVPVHFEFASSELRENDRPVLDRFATVVKEYYPGAIVTVEGFTDPAGSAAYNRRLGQRRADAVKEYLATAGGFTSETLKAVSYGEVRNRQVAPGAKGPGDVGIENRRVALVIDHAAVATDQMSMR
jgi:peptidoglycan-associated lipoprotein